MRPRRRLLPTGPRTAKASVANSVGVRWEFPLLVAAGSDQLRGDRYGWLGGEVVSGGAEADELGPRVTAAPSARGTGPCDSARGKPWPSPAFAGVSGRSMFAGERKSMEPMAARVDPPSGHDLHHDALANGASLEDVQAAAGHANADTTKLHDKRGYNPEKVGRLLRQLLRHPFHSASPAALRSVR
jgi:hypothetical protein